MVKIDFLREDNGNVKIEVVPIATIKEKFKQLLDNVEEIEFINDKKNYSVYSYYSHENAEYYFKIITLYNEEYTHYKYISKENAEKIIQQMHEFINGK